jgi:hypothetical protein
MADDEQEEEKERKRPDEDGDEGAVQILVVTLCLPLRRSVIQY